MWVIKQLGIGAGVEKWGGDSKSMRWVEAPNSIAATALSEHRFEVCNLQEPALTAAMETGKVRILGVAYSAISEHFVYGGYLANADWASKNADRDQTCWVQRLRIRGGCMKYQARTTPRRKP